MFKQIIIKKPAISRLNKVNLNKYPKSIVTAFVFSFIPVTSFLYELFIPVFAVTGLRNFWHSASFNRILYVSVHIFCKEEPIELFPSVKSIFTVKEYSVK
jgi:hypothetical protein